MSTHYTTALITGASSGIGREMALWWARRGTKVYAAARRTELLEKLAEQADGRIVPVALDVVKARETVARIQEIDDTCGGLQLVIANAGVGDPTPAKTSAWPMVERVIDVNVTGAAATLTAVLPRMVERGLGHVVGVSSVAAYIGLGAYSSYSGSKAFLSTFLQSLRVDLVGTGVKVTCIEPGFIRSEMTARIEGRAPMPFMADTDVAADKFCRAIERGTRTCVYPKIHGISSRMLRWIPAPLYEPLAQRASRPQIEMLEAERAARQALPEAAPR